MRRMIYEGTVTTAENTRRSQLQEAKLTVGFKIQVRIGVDHCVPAWVPVKPTQSSGASLSFAFLCEYTTKRDEQQQRRSHGSIFLLQLSVSGWLSLCCEKQFGDGKVGEIKRVEVFV
jgi:hypothetical protein